MSGLFKTKKTTIESSEKIAGIQLNSATYDEIVPIILGTAKISGNIIDYFNFTTITNKSTQSTGKGGKSKTTTVDYSYKAALIIGLSEGPVTGIGSVWEDTDSEITLSSAGLTLFTGEYGQSPWSYAQSKDPTRALPYSGLAYVAGYVDLSSSAAPKNYQFELKGQLLSTGDGIDINPADGIVYIATNIYNGTGLSTSNIDADGLSRLRLFAKATDMYVTLKLNEQSKVYEIINTLCEALNVIVFSSQNKIKFVPRCDETVTGNNETYIPDTTPKYDLTTEDLIADDDGRHVVFKRTKNAETYNQAIVTFTNRENGYESETTDYLVQADINERGLRPMSTLSYDFLYTKTRANYAAQVAATKSVYSRNTYSFKLGWSHCLLEPGDIVTITDPVIGLNKEPVLIETFEEADDEEGFEVEASPLLTGVYSPGIYTAHQADRPSINYYIEPGNVNAPAIFDAPSSITTSGLETWLAVSGGDNWGGCYVWASDDGETYAQIGEIKGPAKHGTLTAVLPSATSPDTTNTLSVNLLGGGVLAGGTQADAENLNTLCWVDGELLAYKTATLTAVNNYNLSYLVRGADSSTIATHAVGSKFVRLSDYIFKYAFTKADIGKKIYLKFVSYNKFQLAEQSLEDVAVYEHTLSNAYVPQASALKVAQNYHDVGDGTYIYELDLSFTPPDISTYDHCDIYRKSDKITWNESAPTTWNSAGNATWNDTSSLEVYKYIGTAINKLTIPGCAANTTYTFKVVAVDTFGQSADSGSAPAIAHTCVIKPYTPVTPSGLVLTFSSVCYASWNKNTDTDIDFYELRTDTNTGVTSGMLFQGNATSSNISLTSRTGTLYLYAHNPSGKYSTPLTYAYNKPAPIVPTGVTITDIFQGIVISCDDLPTTCIGINVYIEDGTATKVYYSTNNAYTFSSTGGIYDIQVAYVDYFGAGNKSAVVIKTIKVTIDPALIEAGSLSMEKMDTQIQGALESIVGGDFVSGTTFNTTVNELRQADTDNGSAITQTANSVTSIVTELGKSVDECSYTAIAQANDAIQLRAKSAELISLINVCPETININSSLLHIAADTLIEGNVIATGMIQAGAVTAAKISVDSLSAITATIGTLRTATTGARTEISDNIIKVYDANNVLRVRMGVW